MTTEEEHAIEDRQVALFQRALSIGLTGKPEVDSHVTFGDIFAGRAVDNGAIEIQNLEDGGLRHRRTRSAL